MIAKAGPVTNQERAALLEPSTTPASPSVSLRYDALILLGIAAVGTVIVAAFWGIWYLIVGSIPKLLGISHFWLDIISAPFYSPILFFAIYFLLTEWEDLNEENEGEFHYSFWEFLHEDWKYPVVCLTLIIDFVVSIFFSFAVGLAGIIALAAIIGLGYGLRVLVGFFAFHIVNFCGGMFSSEESEP